MKSKLRLKIVLLAIMAFSQWAEGKEERPPSPCERGPCPLVPPSRFPLPEFLPFLERSKEKALPQPKKAEAKRLETRVLSLKGIVNPVTERYVVREITRAEEEGTHCVVIKIDTPGGLVESMMKIVTKMLNSKVPVVSYVYPTGAKAGSAGTFIVMAAHVAAMAPGTSMGAARPVALRPEGPGALPKEVERKQVNFLAAYVRAVAKRRGRNVQWAEKAVRFSATLTDDEALKEGVIDSVAYDLSELLNKIEGRKVKLDGEEVTLRTKGSLIRHIPLSPWEKFLLLISNPMVAYLLMTVAIYGIIYELANPGAIFPGVVGVIALLLALASLAQLPLNIAGLVLLLMGLAMLVADIWVASHGILSAGGAISFLIGSFILIDATKGMVGIPWPVIIVTTGLLVGFFGFAVGKGLAAQRRKIFSGRESLIGEVAVASTDIAPKGLVFIEGTGTYWTVVSTEGPIKAGEAVEIVEVEGLRLKVKRAGKPDFQEGGERK